MKLKNTLALSLAAVMAAGLTACGSTADHKQVHMLVLTLNKLPAPAF